MSTDPLLAHKEQYERIVQLYDVAEQLLNTVDEHVEEHRAAQLALIEPLVESIEESADILTEEYIALLATSGKSATQAKLRIESAFRKIYTAIEVYNTQTANRAKRYYKNIFNIADGIVSDLRDLTQKIVVSFMAMMELSVDRIMHTWDIENLRKKEALVALQMHQNTINHN